MSSSDLLDGQLSFDFISDQIREGSRLEILHINLYQYYRKKPENQRSPILKVLTMIEADIAREKLEVEHLLPIVKDLAYHEETVESFDSTEKDTSQVRANIHFTSKFVSKKGKAVYSCVIHFYNKENIAKKIVLSDIIMPAQLSPFNEKSASIYAITKAFEYIKNKNMILKTVDIYTDNFYFVKAYATILLQKMEIDLWTYFHKILLEIGATIKAHFVEENDKNVFNYECDIKCEQEITKIRKTKEKKR
jgi:hypothetical protein